MKKISIWASKHVQRARLLIVVSKVTLFLLAVYTGLLLSDNGITLPANHIYLVVICTFLLVLIMYPERSGSYYRKKFYYARQKFCDFLLPLCSFLVICAAVNDARTPSYFPASFASNIATEPTAARILASGKTKAELTRKEKRILKVEFKKQLKTYVVAKMKNDQQKAGYALQIVLAVIALLGLSYLVAVLACNLSCSGADAAAALVIIFGLGGLIWAFVAFLKYVKRQRKAESK